MKRQLKTSSLFKPLNKEDVKRQLRLDVGNTDEDLLFDSLIDAATLQAENITGRRFVNQTWYEYYDNWPCEHFQLSNSPLSTGTAPIITYKDTDSSSITIGSTIFKTDSASATPRIYIDYNEQWPSETLHNVNPIRIEYVAGYGDNSTSVPAPIRHAMVLMIGHWYENREDTITTFQSGGLLKIPQGSEFLLSPYKVFDNRF